MSNKKQTAVDWLIEQMIIQDYFNSNKPLTYTNLDHLVHQAKAKEKEQIMDAYGDEQSHLQDDGSWEIKTSEQYYKETYGE